MSWLKVVWILPLLSVWTPNLKDVHCDVDILSWNDISPPTFQLEPPSQVDFSNSTGTRIDCVASAKSLSSIRWVNSNGSPVGQLANRLQRILSNGSLIFEAFRAEDYNQGIHAATYRCLISNAIGTVVSRDVRVRAVVMQRYELQVYNEFVIQGNTAVFKCHIPSFVTDYVKVISWIHDAGHHSTHTTIQNGERYTIVPTGELHIQRVGPADATYNYRCKSRHRLTGEVRTSSTSGKLVITNPQGSVSPRITDSRSWVHVREGADAVLSCAAQGYPAPTYSWLVRNNRTSMEALQLLSGRMRISGGNLLISSARKSDQGIYSCVVSNSVGNQTAETTLNVIVPLTVHVRPKEQIVGIGEAATFLCVVHGHPVNNIIWYKDGEMITNEIGTGPTSKGQSGELYVVRSVQKNNQGIYQCVVRNDRDSAQGTAYLRLKDADPELVETFSTQTLSPGDTISLRCSSSGNPPPIIQWSVDGESMEKMTDTVINQFVNQLGDVVGYLNISRISVEHSGNYKCAAKNRAGQSQHTARINVIGALRIREMKKMTIVAGESMIAICRVIGFPFDTITWEKDGMLLPANRRHRVHLNGTLTIQNVHQESDSGKYTCVARSKENTQGARGSVDVMVLVQPKIAPFSFQNTDLYEGMRVQVMCAVRQGDLPITIRWLKNGQALQSSSQLGIAIRLFDGYTSSLSIQSVTPSHNGNYTCVASNAAASVNFTASLNVNVSPKWLVIPTDVKLLSGKDTEVPCSAAGQPPPTISWMKADGDVPQQYSEVDFRSDPHLRILPNGSLYIQDARERDQGYYLCQASNGVGGGLSKVVFIDVQVPVYFETRLINVTGRQGDNIQLVCDARGDVPITVQWKKNPFDNPTPLGSRFVTRNSLNPNGVNSNLEIENVEKTDAGVYRCEGENQFGRDAAEVALIILGVPDSPTDVKVIDFGSRHADLSWTQSDVRNNEVLSYIIRYKTDSGDERHRIFNITVNETSNKVRLTDLRPFTSYSISILAQNFIGTSESSEIVTITTLEEAPAEPPYDIQVEAIEPYTLKITWKEPKTTDWNGELLGYNVGYRIHGLGDPYVFRTTINTYKDGYGQVVLRGLQSYTKYDIIIQAYNRLGAGPSSEVVTATTAEDVPQEAPENVKCVPQSSQSLQVTWQSLQTSRVSSASLRYRVNYHLTNNETYFKDSKTSTNLEIILHGLEKCENYTISVTAISSVGDGATSIPITCHTLEDVPSFPAGIKVMLMSTDKLVVSWKPPQRPNGVIVKYTVYIREVEFGYDNMTKRVVSSEQHHYLVKSIRKNRRYEFWVTASTLIGEGQSTKMVSQVVNDKIPARIVNFGSEVIAVANGNAELLCQIVGDPTPDVIWMHEEKILIFDGRFHKKSDGNLIIKDIRPSDSGQYTCNVKNIHGEDRIKHFLRVEEPPAVVSLAVVSTTFDSISVRLNDVSSLDSEAVQAGYTLHYKREYGEWESRTLTKTSELSTYVLDNLWCGTKYHLYITSSGKFGKSIPPDVLNTRTKGGEPLKPNKDKLIRTFKNYATVNLNAWDDNGCPILYFVVEYKLSTAKEWNLISNNIRLPRDAIVLHDLQLESSYQLRVTAHNRAGSAVATYNFYTIGAQEREASHPGDLQLTNNVPFYRDIKLVASVVTAISGLIIIVIVYVVCTYLQRRMLERNQEENDPDFHKGVPDGCLVHDYGASNEDAKLNYSNQDSKLTAGSIPSSSTLPIDHTKGYREDITPYATYRIPDGNNIRGFSSKVWYEVPSNQ